MLFFARLNAEDNRAISDVCGNRGVSRLSVARQWLSRVVFTRPMSSRDGPAASVRHRRQNIRIRNSQGKLSFSETKRDSGEGISGQREVSVGHCVRLVT